MLKKSKDPFEVFKQATLGSNSSLTNALSGNVSNSTPKQEIEPDSSTHDTNNNSSNAPLDRLKAIIIA